MSFSPVQHQKMMLVAAAVLAGVRFNAACGRFQLKDRHARRWLAAMGLDPRQPHNLMMADIRPAVTRWLKANEGAADKSVRAPIG